MKDKLTKSQLLQLLDKLMQPKANGLTTEESYNHVLLTFCAGCPDPIKARWLVVECLDPMSNEELVERALAMPVRLMADVPKLELAADHPLRNLAL